MKAKFVKTMLSLTVAAAMGVTSPAVLMAAQPETEAAAAESEAEKDVDKEADKKEEPVVDFDITLETGIVTVKNQTERNISKVEL
ncbi:hypothetical protein NXH76_13315 [Blautia schinkii]|nr:hypothetical protein [Blautia schinkii]